MANKVKCSRPDSPEKACKEIPSKLALPAGFDILIDSFLMFESRLGK